MKLLQTGTFDLKTYEDTLRRLLKGDFADLPPEARREKTDQIIKASAMAAMAMSAVPVPLLEMPVMAAMVRAIGKVYGVKSPGKKVMLEIAAAVGGGMVLRQALRLVPFVGGLAGASRIYGNTWAVGRVAEFYFSKGQSASGEEMRRVFRETMEEKSHEGEQQPDPADLEQRLRTLDELHRKNLIDEQEYREKKRALLASL